MLCLADVFRIVFQMCLATNTSLQNFTKKSFYLYNWCVSTSRVIKFHWQRKSLVLVLLLCFHLFCLSLIHLLNFLVRWNMIQMSKRSMCLKVLSSLKDFSWEITMATIILSSVSVKDVSVKLHPLYYREWGCSQMSCMPIYLPLPLF